MEPWIKQGRLAIEQETRPLLRDYIEMLLYTGMRHGTEALNICWNNIEWHTQGDKKYLRIWVDGKTGGRWLIAKHKAVDVLKRLHSRQRAVWDIHTLSKQMGNSAAMIDRHYSKLTATMAADRLA